MKQYLPFLILVFLVLISSCRKSDKETKVNCDDLITDTLGTLDKARISMPNAFTPNGDGINDISRPLTLNIASINFAIYDQSNKLIFSTTDLGKGWHTSVEPDSFEKYYYKIQAITIAGHHIGICGDLYKVGCWPDFAAMFKFEDMMRSDGFTGPTMETALYCNP